MEITSRHDVVPLIADRTRERTVASVTAANGPVGTEWNPPAVLPGDGDEHAGSGRGLETRARLLDAGIRVLADRGYHAARVDDVVGAAAVAHGTFYLYFANKEDLFRALAGECVEAMTSLAASLGPVVAGHAGREELGRWLAELMASYRRYGLVIRALMEEQIPDREATRLGVDGFGAVTRLLTGRLVEADRLRRDQEEAPAESRGAALWAMVERFAYYQASRQLGVTDREAVDTLAALIHRGFFGAPA